MAKNVEEIVLQARDEASDAIGRVGAGLGGMGQVLTRLSQTAGPVGLGLAAVAAGAIGIVRVGAQFANTVEQLDLLSKRSGVSIERLQVLQQSITEAGGNADSLTTALTFLNRAIATQDPMLGKLGITTKDTFDAFIQLSTAFASSSDTAKKTEIAYQLLGRGSAELIGLLPTLGSSFAEMDSKMRASGALIGGEVAEKALALDDQMDTMSRNWKGSLTRMQEATVPWAQSIARAFNDVWDAATGRQKTPTEALNRQLEDLQMQLQANLDGVKKMRASGTSEAFLKEYDDLIAKLRLRIGVLKGLRVEGDETTAFEAAMLSGGADKTDALAGVSLTKNEVDEKLKARIERIKELDRVLIGTGISGEQAAAALDKLADAGARADILTKLGKAPIPEPGPAPLDVLEVSFERIQKIGREGAQLVADEWLVALNDITDSATILDETLGLALGSLTQGFHQVFAEAVSGIGTVSSAFGTIVSSMVDAAIAELARLSAAFALKGLFSLFGGGTGFDMGPGTPVGGIGPAVAFDPGIASLAAQQPAMNVTIQSYDLRDGVREMMSLSGGQRIASSRVAMVGEY